MTLLGPCTKILSLINRIPSWNVDVVLKALSVLPVNHSCVTSMWDLMEKTSSKKVTLARDGRVSELQVPPIKVAWQDFDLVLAYLPEIVVKTETGLESYCKGVSTTEPCPIGWTGR